MTMTALVYRGPGKKAFEECPALGIKAPAAAIVTIEA